MPQLTTKLTSWPMGSIIESNFKENLERKNALAFLFGINFGGIALCLSGYCFNQTGNFFMNLYLWLPGMFFLGVALMGICFLFVCGCEKI